MFPEISLLHTNKAYLELACSRGCEIGSAHSCLERITKCLIVRKAHTVEQESEVAMFAVLYV